MRHGLAARRRAVKVFGRVGEGRRLEKVKVCDVIDIVDSFEA